MKCNSQNTLGVVIGITILVLYAVAGIFAIVSLIHDGSANLSVLLSIVILVCFVMVVLSALLVTGIFKTNHNLMLPWLQLNAVGFIANFIRCIYSVMVQGDNLSKIVVPIVGNIIVIAIWSLALWFIYNLYKNIKASSDNKPIKDQKHSVKSHKVLKLKFK